MRLLPLCLTLVILTACAPTERLPEWVTRNDPTPWTPSKEGVIKDRKTAIIIAHAVWLSVSGRGGSEEDWLADMSATLKDGVWEVATPALPKGYIGGGVLIYLSQRDGRILNISITQ